VGNLSKDLAVNTISVLKALQLAVTGFSKLDESASRTFIFTGNISNMRPVPPMLSLGIGKSAGAHLIAFAAQVYAQRGWKLVCSPEALLLVSTSADHDRFYYADERKHDGSGAYTTIDGDAHGDFYLELSNHKTQRCWLATFVKGVGYVNFDSKDKD
jgi:hypothetical protein